MNANTSTGTARWHCKTCGQVSVSYAAAERHSNTHRGARIETEFEEKAR